MKLDDVDLSILRRLQADARRSYRSLSQELLLAGTTNGLFEANDLDSFGDWTAVGGEGLPESVSSVAVSPDGQTLFASTGDGLSGSTDRSIDGGTTWSQLTAPGLQRAAAPVLFAVDPADSGHVFASTAAALVMESRDHGATWTTIRNA